MENTNKFNIEKASEKRKKFAIAFGCLRLVGVLGLAIFASSLEVSLGGNIFVSVIICWLFVSCICSGYRWAAITLLVF